MSSEDEKAASDVVAQSMMGMLVAEGTVLSLLIGALEDNGALVPGVVLERLGKSVAEQKRLLQAAGKADDPMQTAIVTFTETLYACMSDFDRARRGGELSG